MKGRLKSLDILRGATVAGMIVVNNGHSGSFETLRHSQWNGMTLCDLVFPFFLFIMGVSIALSFFRFTRNPSQSKPVFKIIKRTLLLLLIGLAINWLDNIMGGGGFGVSDLRFMGVLQRIAICYFAASLLALYLPGKSVPLVCLVILCLYAVLLTMGNGYTYSKEENILSIVDHSIFRDSHLYHKSPVDPEGLVSTVAALVNVLLGVWTGGILKHGNFSKESLLRVFSYATIILAAGYFWAEFMPLNKRIWSPSYTLVTSGFCALFLSSLVWLEKENGMEGKVSLFFRIFGVNPLALYVASEIIAIVAGGTGISDGLFNLIGEIMWIPQLQSLIYALIFLFLNFLLGLWLWRNRIFIKL